jgi:predicted hydrocarbon binding protein
MAMRDVLQYRGVGMEETRKYRFSWEQLGDANLGRPNLGPYTRIEVYRLMQLSFRDIIEQEYGTKAADIIFYKAGYLAGEEFYRNVLGETADLNTFVKKLQTMLREMGIGILRVEETDMENGRLVITVSEDLDCSGLPEGNHVFCAYDEGFIAALLKSFTGEMFEVKEVDCWCTGDRTCRFVAQAST